MNVAIVYPEVYDIARFGRKRKEFPPFGVLYLATVIGMQHGISVKVFCVESAKTCLDLRQYDVVAFSISSSVTYNVIAGVRKHSLYADDAMIIAGGVHANIFPEQTLADLDVSAVGIGQGDETILELLQAKETGDFASIRGICYRSNGSVVRTEPRPLKQDLDHLPAIPHRNLLPDPDFIMRDRLAGTDMMMTHVMVAVGCPFSCNFCASQQKRLQYRSGHHIREELEYLRDEHSIEGFAVVGDNFLVNKKRVREICDAVAGLGLKWSTLSRVDTVDPASLRALRHAGCIEIKFGIETGSQRLLEAMGKGITVEQIYDAIRLTRNTGIGVKAFIVHGYPGENMDTTRQTIQMLDDLASCIDRVSLFRFVPLPGSVVHEGLERSSSRPGNGWERCHIHHNPHHWWGTADDFAQVEASFRRLDQFILERWE